MQPSELSHERLVALVERIRDAFWPEGDPDHEWSADTLDETATALIEAGVRPGRTHLFQGVDLTEET
jgi:hypothetical protein